MQLRREDDLIISDDPARLDVDRISAWLAASYWAGDRDRATVARSLESSLTYGVYATDGTQIAVTRVVTDRTTFAWLCDVVVDDAWRARGIGRWLVGAVVDELRAMGVMRIVLATRDAHGVYEQVGFAPLRIPQTWMEIDMRPTRPDPRDVRAAVP
jgi:GNAT superfamily N-acetyltransferase